MNQRKKKLRKCGPEMSKKRDSYLLIILIFGLIIYENYTNGVLFVLRYRNKAKEEIKQMFIALKNNIYFKAFHSRVVHCFNQVVIILRLFFHREMCK